MNNYLRIFDTTLRDGEQSPGNSMNLSEKIRMAIQLERLGVDVIEAGFPIASPDDFAAVKAIAKVCKQSEVCGLARAMDKDINVTWDAIKFAKKPRIHTFIATSEIHMKYKLKKSKEEVLQMAVKSVKLAKSLCRHVDFSPEDAIRSDKGFMFKVLEAAIDSGADVVNIPDTVGYSTPEEYGKLIAEIKSSVPNIDKAIISTHCHNDLGLAGANTLAGIANGARQAEVTINGIGERAGNAALEEVVMAINTRPDYFHVRHGISTHEIWPSSRLLSSITGIPVQPNKAIVGVNAFSHESGIHQDGVLKERTTYEIMRAQDIGLDSNNFVLGKHSGRHALKDSFAQLGYNLDSDKLNTVFKKFKKLADKKKKIYEADLILMLNDITESESFYVLKSLDVHLSTETLPVAKIVLTNKEGEDQSAEVTGDGPVDAAFGAVNKIIRLDNKLVDYSVNSVTEGIDAQATVAVQIRVKDKLYSESDSDTDIVVASVKAYIDALNKALTTHSVISIKKGI